MLDPQARMLLDMISAAGLPPVDQQAPVAAREGYRLRRSFTQPDPPLVGRVREHWVSSGSARITVREYRPIEPASKAALPALLYLHGGGWTIGDLETHDVLCRSLCKDADCVVLSVDYRLAPENPFPAAYEDALAAFDWAAAQAQTLGIDAGRIAIGGDSAGGNLAAAACIGLRGRAAQPAFQLLIYPATDLRCRAPSHDRNGQGYLLTSAAIAWFLGHYLTQPGDYADWRASPLLAASHAKLPPALVLTAGFDPLRDEGLQYANALSKAGVSTEYVCFERQIHGFITMGRVLGEANTALALCSLALRKALQ
ncbi:MAG: alpha/beta hydrolase [Rhodoferax sp.]